MTKKNIAIFASGEGSNAKAIMDYFKNSDAIQVALVVSNSGHCGVIQKAHDEDVPLIIYNYKSFFEGDELVERLKEKNIDWIILAGFLWKISDKLIEAFPDRIINIHPALLPKFGGKGMYGINVHKAVLAAKEKESGITIHYVNSNYDEGKIITQVKCDVSPQDSPNSLAQKIKTIEHAYYPQEIEKIIKKTMVRLRD